MEPRRRCLSTLERRLGSVPFLELASFAPMTCLAGIHTRLEIVAARVRENVLLLGEAHRLRRFLDQPDHPTHRISAAALGTQISTFYCSTNDRAHLDPDDVFGLLAARQLDVSWALPDRDSYGKLEDDEVLLCTPLFLAIVTELIDTCRLLVHLRADVNGDQWQQFGYEIKPFERQTPLSIAVCSRHPALVKLLLQARAEANGYAYEKLLCNDDWPSSLQHFGCGLHKMTSPLWDAVYNVYKHGPGSEARCVDIVRLLLDHNAKPQEYPAWLYDTKLGPGGETIEHHARESKTTPLRLAMMAPGRDGSLRDLVHLLSRGA